MSAARTPQRPGSDPLEPYRRKRNFARTPEPAAEAEAGRVAGEAAGSSFAIHRKVTAGETQTVQPVDAASAEAGLSNVVDLTELLAKSLAKRKPAAPAATSKSAARTTRKRA